jgi:hypothetical protein
MFGVGIKADAVYNADKVLAYCRMRIINEWNGAILIRCHYLKQ